ncbi:hypothetical protein IG631_07184 [Alternaria alternata]|nr:hypothetical protein IG631_07184 [Alternaria alternata]
MTEGCRASRVSKRDQLVQWTFGVWAGRGKNECPAVRSDDDSAAWYGSRKRRAILQGWRPPKDCHDGRAHHVELLAAKSDRQKGRELRCRMEV